MKLKIFLAVVGLLCFSCFANAQESLIQKTVSASPKISPSSKSSTAKKSLKAQAEDNISNDNLEGEDPVIRKAAIEALGKHDGTVVVMDTKNGNVLSIVNQEWAVRKGFTPCSTIKLITTIAGLEKEIIEDSGLIRNNTNPLLKELTLSDAIAHSSNWYFQGVGKQLGTYQLTQYAHEWGLGQRTGINMEGENPGLLPYAYGKENLEVYSHGTGFKVTPLQMAVIASAIGNGGKKVVPKIQNPRNQKISDNNNVSKEIDISPEILKKLMPGMMGAVQYGTARNADHSIGIAGKTGTCSQEGFRMGWFTSFAPADNPKFTIVVLTHGTGEKGGKAAVVASNIYAKVLPRNFEESPPKYSEGSIHPEDSDEDE